MAKWSDQYIDRVSKYKTAAPGAERVEPMLLDAEDGEMAEVTFVRRVDGSTYEFVRDGEAGGFPSYRRVDLDIRCCRLPDYGWVVCTESGVVSARPFDDAGRDDLPPEGVWVSRKGERSYVYDLIRAPAT